MYIVLELSKYLKRYFSLQPVPLLLTFSSFWILFYVLRGRGCGRKSSCIYACYGSFIAHLAWFCRKPGAAKSSIHTLFSTYEQFSYDYHSSVIFNIVLNIVMFIPLGFIMAPKLRLSKVALYGIYISVLIEVVQLIFGLGVFEICDLIHNVFGVVCGWSLERMWTRMRSQYKKEM